MNNKTVQSPRGTPRGQDLTVNLSKKLTSPRNGKTQAGHARANTITVGDYRQNPFAGGDVDYEAEKKFFLKKSPQQSPRHNQTALETNRRRVLSPDQAVVSNQNGGGMLSGETDINDLDGKMRDVEFDREVNKYVMNKMKNFASSKYVKPTLNTGHVSPTKLES